jgi:type 1 glutamine amidotransferase
MTTSVTATRVRTAQVVIAGDDVYEDLFTASVELQDLLSAAGFVTRIRMGTALFAHPLDDDLIVLYRAAGSFSAAEQRGLADAVAAGTGLLSIHSSAVFESSSELVALFGARYVEHGPQPHESRFGVRLAEHPVTAGLAEFELTHEHYRVELADGLDVVAWRDAPYGPEPLVAVQRYGDGRVCFVQFGHDLRVWDEPAVRDIVTNAAVWLTSASVTAPESAAASVFEENED